MIVGISSDGLGIEMPEAVPVKSNIAVQSEGAIALGEVRFCREGAPGRFARVYNCTIS